MEFIKQLLNPEVVWIIIPVVAIVMSIGSKMLNRHYEHQERMAEIEAGLMREEDLRDETQE